MNGTSYILLSACCLLLSLSNLWLWLKVTSLERRLGSFLFICKKHLDRVKEHYNV